MDLRSRCCPRGFTLVEFLATIAIIFVLAGLIFAASVAVIRSGKSSSCLNNLKQMHLALLLFAESNNDVIPPVGLQTSLQPDDPIVQSSNRRFAELIKNYQVSNDQLFCPFDEYKGTQVQSGSGLIDRRVSSYAQSKTAWILDWISTGELYDIRSSWELNLSQISVPSKTKLFFDETYPLTANDQFAPCSHGEFANVVYYDGHASRDSLKGPFCHLPGMSELCPN